MKLAVTSFVHGVNNQELNDALVILDQRLHHEQIMASLAADAKQRGPFQLVCYDTFQAGFSGKDFNNNAETLDHAKNLRELTTLPGNPSVLVACHPVKNPSRDNLEPYGGGSVMNEFDGNMTLWNEGGSIELAWNKVRGPEFEPRSFRIELLGSPDILDNKGRQPQLPVMRPMSQQTVDDRRTASDADDLRLLHLLRDQPTTSQGGIASTLGWYKSKVNRKLRDLTSGGYVHCALGKYALTAKAERAMNG
jgi:hypothetical protein